MGEGRNEFADVALDVIDDDEQRRTRIAWLYYIEGKTQIEIAEMLGANRTKVTRDLSVCRETGLVQIRINGRFSSCVALERDLVRRFRLKDVVVVPTPSSGADLPAVLGMTLGAYVSDRLEPGMTVGVGWGRTLRRSVRLIRRRPVPGLTVVSLLGGLGQSSELNTCETASRFAEALEATCHYLAAPTFTTTSELRDMLLDQAGLRQVCERACNADMAVMSVGSLEDESTMVELGLLTGEEQKSLIAAGAVGDLLGHFLDRSGRLVDHPVNRRVVGVSPDDLRRVPMRILAAGGPEKIDVTLAALRARHATTLITDERTAEALRGAGRI